MVPLTILLSPSSEQLVGPSPVSLGEDLLGPDGSFRSTGLATTDGTHGLVDASCPVLASRLRERRKRSVSFPPRACFPFPVWPTGYTDSEVLSCVERACAPTRALEAGG